MPCPALPRLPGRPARITSAHGHRSWLIALLLGAACATAGAQTPAPAPDVSGWTGDQQDPAVARKEAVAALAEGRRECGRQPAAERAACLKKVQADHDAMLKRLGTGGKSPPKRSP